MNEPRGQEPINRYRWNYGIAEDVSLTEEMIPTHWSLERRLTRELLASTRESRWATFERCYTTLYGELDWLNRLIGSTSTTPAADRYRHWGELVGTQPKCIYEVGSGKATMISYLAQLGHQCTATEITRERGAMHAVQHPNLRWTQTDGVNLAHFEPSNSFDFVISDNVIEHLHPDDLTLHLSGAREILKNGGKYLLAVPHRWFGPSDISRVFKYEIACGMHLKEYTYRELSKALRLAGFSVVASVRLPLPGSSQVARSDARTMQWLCLLEAVLSPFAQPILRGRIASLAKRAGVAPLIFLAATK